MVIAQVFVISALRSDDYTEEAYKALSSDELAVIRENDLGGRLPYIALGVWYWHCHYHIYKMPKTPEEDKMSLSESFSKLFANKITYKGF